VRAEEFLPAADRSALRVSHGIRPDTFVIAAVSALKREHKRLDYVIREVARLQGDVLLWIDGNPEDSEIPRLASQLLGQRMRITHLPSTKIRELYQLADVFVHAALEEAFGLAILEAACCGLPALIHDNLHFRWLLGDQAWRLDMSREGALSAVLYTMATHRQQVRERALRNSASIRARYAWQSLAKDYLTMYRKVARLSKKAHLAAEPHTLASGRGNHA
jgi:glycosyltransferase involved in cell wall biosynthesis